MKRAEEFSNSKVGLGTFCRVVGFMSAQLQAYVEAPFLVSIMR